jgi:hypothetical protein
MENKPKKEENTGVELFPDLKKCMLNCILKMQVKMHLKMQFNGNVKLSISINLVSKVFH